MIKSNCRPATLLQRRLQYKCVLVNIAKFVRRPFLKKTTGQLLLVITVSIAAKGESANETVNNDTKLKTRHKNLSQ